MWGDSTHTDGAGKCHRDSGAKKKKKLLEIGVTMTISQGIERRDDA